MNFSPLILISIYMIVVSSVPIQPNHSAAILNDHRNDCTIEQYLCRESDKCIIKKFICDGQINCPKGDDEAGCEMPTTVSPNQAENECGIDKYKCRDFNRCINSSQLCDGKIDCVQADDEFNAFCHSNKAKKKSQMIDESTFKKELNALAENSAPESAAPKNIRVLKSVPVMTTSDNTFQHEGQQQGVIFVNFGSIIHGDSNVNGNGNDIGNGNGNGVNNPR